MKKLKLFIMTSILTGALNSFGQDPNYTGPAKLHVKSFWELATKLKAGTGGSYSNLEKQLKYVKEKDPTYNTSSMEAELLVWKDKAPTKTAMELANEKVAANKKKTLEDGNKKFKEEQSLSKAIEGTKMTFGTYDVPGAQAKMDEYKKLCDEVLQIDLSLYATKLEEMKMRIDRGPATYVDQLMSKSKSLYKETTKSEYFYANYEELRFHQLYFDLVRKVYPTEPSYEKKYQEITTTINGFGGKEGIEKTAAKNNAEKIKNRKLDAAVAKDPVLEKFVADKFNTIYNYGTCLKVVLTQDGWTTERNQITGIITGRNRTTQVAYKGKDGKCYLLSGILYIHEEYNGSSYVNRDVVYKGLGGDEMLCENVK